MLRLLATMVVSLLSSAVAFIATAAILADFSLDWSGFIVAVVVFSAVMVLISPLLRQIALTKANYLMGGTALVATLIALIVADIVSKGLSITGGVTWIEATVLVWLIGLVAQFLLPFVIFREVLARHREEHAKGR